MCGCQQTRKTRTSGLGESYLKDLSAIEQKLVAALDNVPKLTENATAIQGQLPWLIGALGAVAMGLLLIVVVRD